MKRLPRTVLAFGLLLWLTGAARPDYIFTTLEGVIATGINDSGDIVGGYTAGSYLYSGGSYTPISMPERLSFTDAKGINNAGQIVGYYGDDSGLHGFLLSGGSYTRIDVPGSFRTFAYGINNAGQIVGTYQVGGDTGPELGFLLNGGAFSTIGLPTTRVHAINDRGQILEERVLLTDGRASSVYYPLALASIAWGINDAGDIVGGYDTQTAQHGFLLKDAVYSTIDFPGATDTAVLGINNADQLVGLYVDAAGNQHAFLATPTPEPSTILLLGLGSIGLIPWVCRRVRRQKCEPGNLGVRYQSATRASAARSLCLFLGWKA